MTGPTKHMGCVLAASLVALSTGAAAFDLQGHRGARGLAAENTLAGFTTALAIGVSTLELDLAMTRDGVLVVHHDIWLNPATTRGPDGNFLERRGPAIRSLTLAELQRYDVGRIKPGTAYAARFATQRGMDRARIPLLTDVFALARALGADHIRFNIETKLTPSAGDDAPEPEAFARAVAAAVRLAGLASRVSVQSFDWRTLRALARIAPEIERVCLSSQGADEDTIERGRPGPSPWTAGLDVDDHGGSTPRLVKIADCAGWSPSFRDLTADALAEAKRLGLKVIPWTVNEHTDMERLLDMGAGLGAGLGVDGIITDYPDRLRHTMAARGLPLPSPIAAR